MDSFAARGAYSSDVPVENGFHHRPGAAGLPGVEASNPDAQPASAECFPVPPRSCEPQLNLSAALVGGADSSARVSARRAASTSPSASCASASTCRRIQLSACASPGATVSSAAPRIADANQVVAKKIPRHANGWIRQVSIGLFQFLFQCDFEFPARLVIAALRGKNGREESTKFGTRPIPCWDRGQGAAGCLLRSRQVPGFPTCQRSAWAICRFAIFLLHLRPFRPRRPAGRRALFDGQGLALPPGCRTSEHAASRAPSHLHRRPARASARPAGSPSASPEV